jgi:(p)ppGpp synthase/HD superfamily hydrolase
MSLALQAAQALAATSHGDQKYGETLPYVKHLADVVEVLKRFNVTDEEMLIAGWLHDVVEDTSTSLLHVELTFGRRVADLVHRVTNEEGKNRRERHEKTYPKIQASDDAITLKLADRIANIEFSYIANDEDKLKMYAKEYKGFREKLYKPGVHDAMWRHLDFLIGYDGVNAVSSLVD